MIKENVKYSNFSEVSFIRLYCAMSFKYRCFPIIKHHELEKKLYEFYSLPEFSELFCDICPKKDYINPENSYLNLQTAINTAQLFGILTPIRGNGESRSIIALDENIALEIISNTDTKMVNKMASLFNKMFDLNTKKEKCLNDLQTDVNFEKEIQGPSLVKRNEI